MKEEKSMEKSIDVTTRDITADNLHLKEILDVVEQNDCNDSASKINDLGSFKSGEAK